MNKELSELSAEILGLKVRNFFYTFCLVVRRPGQTARDYCEGKDDRLIPPLVYGSTVFFLLFCLDKVSGFADYAKGFNEWLSDLVSFTEPEMGFYARTFYNLGMSYKDDWIRNLIWMPSFTISLWVFGRPFMPEFRHTMYFVLLVDSTMSAFLLLMAQIGAVLLFKTAIQSIVLFYSFSIFLVCFVLYINYLYLVAILKFYKITFRQALLRFFHPAVLTCYLTVTIITYFIVYRILE